jgi:hypothetical protein
MPKGFDEPVPKSTVAIAEGFTSCDEDTFLDSVHAIIDQGHFYGWFHDFFFTIPPSQIE